MYPVINGKALYDCTLTDIQEILGDEEYRESEYIDYKETFSFLNIPKENKNARNKEKAEFRKDVCALANAQGGYLIYGIRENEKGIPDEIIGVEIPDNNTDRFEGLLKDFLQTVMPRIPNYRIRFIPHQNRYVILLYVYRDYYAPYVFIENNHDYQMFKRVGNSVKSIPYVELKQMFVESISFEKEIDSFRNERVDTFLAHEDNTDHDYSRFIIFHIIPDTFLDSSYDTPLYILDSKQGNLSNIFYSFECDTFGIPMIKGIRYRGRGVNAECRLYNNGIAEFFYPMKKYYYYEDETKRSFVYWDDVWRKIERAIPNYISKMKDYIRTNKLYMCLGIVGCKDAYTTAFGWNISYSDLERIGSIDRNRLLCEPVVFDITKDYNYGSKSQKKLKLAFLLSLGARENSEMDGLIKELYGE